MRLTMSPSLYSNDSSVAATLTARMSTTPNALVGFIEKIKKILTFCDANNLWRHVHVVHRQHNFLADCVLTVACSNSNFVRAVVGEGCFPHPIVSNRF